MESASDFWALLAPTISYFQEPIITPSFPCLLCCGMFWCTLQSTLMRSSLEIVCPAMSNCLLSLMNSLVSDQIGKTQNGFQRYLGNLGGQVTAIDHYWCHSHGRRKQVSLEVSLKLNFESFVIDSNRLNCFWNKVCKGQVMCLVFGFASQVILGFSGGESSEHH